MPERILYVYAIGRDLTIDGVDGEPVDIAHPLETVASGELSAVYSLVDPKEFSQDAIDARSNDVNWLGVVAYRHQSVVSALAEKQTVIPLRAFTLFGSVDALGEYLKKNASDLKELLQRVTGREEWTMRIEFDPVQWSAALIRRADSLRAIDDEMRSAPAGKAYLLKKKLEELKKKVAREEEEKLVGEIGRRISTSLGVPTQIETREQRGGSFPQINILAERERRTEVDHLRGEIERDVRGDGVSIALTGPWPPYSFTQRSDA